MRFQHMILAAGMLGAIGAATPALAAMDAADAMAFCSRLTNKDARLECYDQVTRDVAAGRLSSGAPAPAPSLGAAPAPQQSWATPPAPQSWSPPPPPGAAPSAPATNAVAPSFGSQALRPEPGTDGPKEIQAAVRASTDNGIGQWQITLADGAVWRMTERVSMFRPPAPNETVTIRKGALGGFLMDVGKQASVRVMRVR